MNQNELNSAKIDFQICDPYRGSNAQLDHAHKTMVNGSGWKEDLDHSEWWTFLEDQYADSRLYPEGPKHGLNRRDKARTGKQGIPKTIVQNTDRNG
jgi:hypothetical protein